MWYRTNLPSGVRTTLPLCTRVLSQLSGRFFRTTSLNSYGPSRSFDSARTHSDIVVHLPIPPSAGQREANMWYVSSTLMTLGHQRKNPSIVKPPVFFAGLMNSFIDLGLSAT